MIKLKTTDNQAESRWTASQSKKRNFKFKPGFWTYTMAGDSHTGIDFKRKWRLLVLFTTIMVLTPLFIMMIVDAKISLRTLKQQTVQNMTQLVMAYAESVSQKIQQTGKDYQNHEQIPYLNDYLERLRTNKNMDLFLVDSKGRILTTPVLLDAHAFLDSEIVKQLDAPTGLLTGLKTSESDLISVFTKVPETDLTLLLAKVDIEMSMLYFTPRIRLIGYLIASFLVIILSIMGTTTYLVSRIHQADKKRVNALHHAESANKLAAIGRLASGVAHEVNNPLAIINEKNGLLLDILSAQEKTEQQQRLISLASDVTGAVRRCGRITRRLLDFARHMEPSIELVSVENIVRQILSFYEKEAERLQITTQLDFSDQIPDLKTDKGSLQQIFLNLIENAFDAMKNGGELTISAGLEDDVLKVSVADTGTGIAKEERHKIFEPFYSSKKEMWKTGLGLSITYGLVKEIHGDITVKSSAGIGSKFILTLPIKINAEKYNNEANQ